MLGKNRIKIIRSLEHKKYRLKEKLFVAEGTKLVTALLASGWEVEFLAATPGWLRQEAPIAGNAHSVEEASPDELARATFLKTAPPCLALCRLPEYSPELISPGTDLVLCLDGIQDPGNLGTIVRLAGWFGISDVVCSGDSADLFAPKALQATMGALAGIRVHYLPLAPFLEQNNSPRVEITGTFLDGENIYTAHLPGHGIVVMGNEGQGIRPAIAPLISRKVTIPDFAPAGIKPESLNVSVATAIVLSEFRRRKE
jgi:TrmH family RNA methyltransferase